MPLLALLALLTACTGGEEPAPITEGGTPITFAGGLHDDEAVTRAVGLESKGITSFRLWGYKNTDYTDSEGYTATQTVMDAFSVQYAAATELTSTTNTHGWEYVGYGDQTVKYWDWGARAYRFFAVAEGDGSSESHKTYKTHAAQDSYELTLTADGSSKAGIEATPYYSRLWFSNGSPVDYPTRQFGLPVQLEFLQPLARVRFMFTFVEGLPFTRAELYDIGFGPADAGAAIATKGEVTITYPLEGNATGETWVSTPSADGRLAKLDIDYYEPQPGVTPEEDLASTYPNSPEHWHAVLPVKSQVSYRLSVVVVSGEPRTVEVPAEYMSWQPGHDYTYRFKIVDGGNVTLDQVQVGINSWVPREVDEHPVYNW